jgi:hypothetical protein
LRFSRDKRGYENTFVVHSERRRGKARSRILYWFRTPPGVKVGRSALDEDAIRRIEESNPTVEFDWTQILKGQVTPAPPTPRFQTRSGKPSRAPREPRTSLGERPQPARQISEEPLESDLPAHSAGQEAIASEIKHVEETPASEWFADPEPLPATAAGPVQGSDTPSGIESDVSPAPADEPPTAAHARLGAEGVLRLRARHAEILARISERISDPVRREELKLQADRLNPDTWVTGDEVATGIEQYEMVFEGLRSVVGRRRKRRRRRGGGSQAPTGGAPEASGWTAPADGPDADADMGAPEGEAEDDSDEL